MDESFGLRMYMLIGVVILVEKKEKRRIGDEQIDTKLTKA